MDKKLTRGPGLSLPRRHLAMSSSSSDIPEDYEELPAGTPVWVNPLAGALAGIAEHSITYPFDSIKVYTAF